MDSGVAPHSRGALISFCAGLLLGWLLFDAVGRRFPCSEPPRLAACAPLQGGQLALGMQFYFITHRIWTAFKALPSNGWAKAVEEAKKGTVKRR